MEILHSLRGEGTKKVTESHTLSKVNTTLVALEPLEGLANLLARLYNDAMIYNDTG